MTKELRAKLSAAVLEAYEAAVQNEEAAVSLITRHIPIPIGGGQAPPPRKEVVADWNIS